MQGLPPGDSLTMALASGGRDHYGWSLDTHILAGVFDAVNGNTRATGNWGKGKAPKFPTWPRPKSKPEGSSEAKRPVSVFDVWNKFQKKV